MSHDRVQHGFHPWLLPWRRLGFITDTAMPFRRVPVASTGFIEPCLPSPAREPPSGSDWLHEIKFDGYRMVALSSIA
jgi:hypothetical protein